MKVSKAQGAYLIFDADAQFLCGHRPEGLQCIRTEKNRTNKEMFLLITAQGKEVSYGTEKGQICGTV